MEVPKRERLIELLAQALGGAKCATFDEALQQVVTIMNAVEDELTEIPSDPKNWHFDGRIYPPQLDNMYAVPAHPRVKRFRSLGHNTYIGVNGSIEVASLDGTVELSKPGLDGRNVWELE